MKNYKTRLIVVLSVLLICFSLGACGKKANNTETTPTTTPTNLPILEINTPVPTMPSFQPEPSATNTPVPTNTVAPTDALVLPVTPTVAPTKAQTNTNTGNGTSIDGIAISPANDVVYCNIDDGALNVRSGPAATYDKIGTYKRGDEIKRTGICANGWIRVDLNGKTGFVSGLYISASKPGTTTTAQTSTPVPTTVPPTPTASAGGAGETNVVAPTIAPVVSTPVPTKVAVAFPEITASAYVVFDINTGDILYAENENERIYPASLAKMMTAIVAIENQKGITVDTKISATAESLNNTLKDPSLTNVGASVGTTYTLNEWLHALLLTSASDAADTIAVGIGGTYEEFVRMMNDKAKELGMTNTHFDNAIGLDKGDGFNETYTTAADLAILTKYFSQTPVISTIANTNYFALNDGKRTRNLENSNKLLFGGAYATDSCYIYGAKTGYTTEAGYCLAAVAESNVDSEKRIGMVFLGGKTRESSFSETFQMIEYIMIKELDKLSGE